MEKKITYFVCFLQIVIIFLILFINVLYIDCSEQIDSHTNTSKAGNIKTDLFEEVDKATIGAIKISANVNDAKITINGIFVGYTPIYIRFTPRAIASDSEIIIEADLSILSTIEIGPTYCVQREKIKCGNLPKEINFDMHNNCPREHIPVDLFDWPNRIKDFF